MPNWSTRSSHSANDERCSDNLNGLRLVGRPHPIRVVFVDHVARLSGGEIALVRLLRAVRHDVEAVVVLGEDGPLRAHLEDAGATVEILPMLEPLRDMRRGQVTPIRLSLRPVLYAMVYVWRLRRRLLVLRPDVVHTNSLKSALYGGLAGRLAGLPVVWHVRDRIARDYLPLPAVVLVRALSRVLPTRILANSQATLATLPASRRGSVLLNPVVSDDTPTATDATSRPSRGAGPLRVGIVGRLAPWKGHDVLLHAFAAAFAPGGAELRIIGSSVFGEDAYTQHLIELAEHLGISGDVVWRGFRDDVAAELAELDILVLASTTPEPFGSVVVEGMAAGLPVVATAAGGPLEIVEHERTGLLVPPGDADALAAALKRLAGDDVLRHRLGSAGAVASQRFGPSAARATLLQVYSRLPAGPRPVSPAAPPRRDR